MGHLQVVILTFGVAIQCAGFFIFVWVWAGERDLVIAHAGSDGTRRRTGGEVKGKDANGVGSQSSCIHTPHSSTASS